MGKEHEYGNEYFPIVVSKPGDPERVSIPIQVKFYLCRLADMTDLLRSVDRGDYPVEDYEGVPVLEGPVSKDNLKLQPTNYSKGLRRSVVICRQGVRNILADMGYQKEADTYLKTQDQLAQNRHSQAQVQQEGRM